MKVPVHVLSGFLGTGKTTAVKDLLGRRADRERIAVVVNEFGTLGVDGALLSDCASCILREVPGGCVCCTAMADLEASLEEIWELADRAMRAFPPVVPASTFGFPWFRFWVRPLVPDIDAIPEAERAYYERFMVATFNNPARVDLNNDMLWNFLSVAQAREKKLAFDTHVLPPLDAAVAKAASLLASPSLLEPAKSVFLDLRDRLVALRCFAATLRNCMAWTESVHGYLEATTDADREAFRALARGMVIGELENTKRLLELWQRASIDFIPVSAGGETAHIYGDNFGGLLKRKIALMENHMDDAPRIDPGFMWRMPGCKSPASASPQGDRRP